MISNIKLSKPVDMHVHLRDGEMLQKVARYTAEQFSSALIMPNLTPPIQTKQQVTEYKTRIMEAAKPHTNFLPLMTFKILPETTPEMVTSIKPRFQIHSDTVAGKVYPKGLTTNAQDGVENYFQLFPVFERMEEVGLVLCLHGELPGDNLRARDREKAFLRTLRFIARKFPKLRIVMEHITTAAAVDAILGLSDNVAATITAHHLVLTLEDVCGKRMCPDHYCKPIAKDSSDREALRSAATSGSPQFFFGSDSAPHSREGKERGMDCCAGIFTAPVLLPLLATIFEEEDCLPHLEQFVCRSASRFYGLVDGQPSDNVTLVREPWTVPDRQEGLAVFLGGTTLPWSIQKT